MKSGVGLSVPNGNLCKFLAMLTSLRLVPLTKEMQALRMSIGNGDIVDTCEAFFKCPSGLLKRQEGLTELK